MADQDPGTFKEFFTPLGAALAFFGGLGGLVRALVIRAPWRETLRVIIIGSGTAFGLGALSPHVLKWMVGDLPADVSGALGTLCATAFIVGVIAVAVVERLISTSEGDHNEKP
jgi:hypothetical protein